MIAFELSEFDDQTQNAATVLENAWQHCIDPITMLSDAFGLRFVNSTDIDEFLSANIEKKLSVTDLLTTKYRGCCNVTDPAEGLNKDHTNLLPSPFCRHIFGKIPF